MNRLFTVPKVILLTYLGWHGFSYLNVYLMFSCVHNNVWAYQQDDISINTVTKVSAKITVLVGGGAVYIQEII